MRGRVSVPPTGEPREALTKSRHHFNGFAGDRLGLCETIIPSPDALRRGDVELRRLPRVTLTSVVIVLAGCRAVGAVPSVSPSTMPSPRPTPVGSQSVLMDCAALVAEAPADAAATSTPPATRSIGDECRHSAGTAVNEIVDNPPSGVIINVVTDVPIGYAYIFVADPADRAARDHPSLTARSPAASRGDLVVKCARQRGHDLIAARE